MLIHCGYSCRTEECSFDEMDCDEDNMCSAETECYLYALGWKTFVPVQEGMNITYICTDLMPTIIAAGYEQRDDLVCEDFVPLFDYNDDQHINFRYVFKGAPRRFTLRKCPLYY